MTEILAEKLYRLYTESMWFSKPWEDLDWEEKEIWKELADLSIRELDKKIHPELQELVKEASFINANVEKNIFETVFMAHLMLKFPDIFNK